MGDRRTSKRGRINRSVASSSSQPPREPEIPLEQYQAVIQARPLNPERTMANLKASPSFVDGIQFYGLEGLLEVTTRRNEPLVYQYHIAYASTQSPRFVLRNTLVPEVTPETFVEMYGLRMEPNCIYAHALEGAYPKEAIEAALTMPGQAKWKSKCELERSGTHHMTKNWQNFLATNVLPVKHRSSLAKKLSLLIYLIMQREPLCFPTIMCREFHENIKEFKLTPGPRESPCAISFPHFVSAFCALHHVPARGLDYYSSATSYQMKKDQDPATFPRPQAVDLDEIFGDIPSPPPQQQQDQAGGSREIPLDDEFLNNMHEEIREEQRNKVLEEIAREQRELRQDMDEVKGGMRALLRHFRLIPEDIPPRRAPSTPAPGGDDEEEDDDE